MRSSIVTASVAGGDVLENDMALDPERGQTELARSLKLLAWWGEAAAPVDGAAEPMQRIRELVVDAQTALHEAGQAQADLIAEFNHDLPALVLNVAKARDPQALLDAQLELSARLRVCGLACARAWIDLLARSSAWPPRPAASANLRDEGHEDRQSKKQAEARRV